MRGLNLLALGYRPLTYMWIAEFSDGTCLPQFDPDTGKQNKGDPAAWLPTKGIGPPAKTPRIFLEKKLVRFGWYPFSAKMAAKIQGMIVIPTRNPHHVIDLEEGDELVACTRKHIEFSVKGGGTRRAASLYLLGIRGGEIKEIKEDGSLRQNA